MKHENNPGIFGRLPKPARPWLFPLGVAGLYGLGLLFEPVKTGHALHISGLMFYRLAGPISLALIIMIVLNKFLSPAMIMRFLGQKTGLKGILLSSLAGILSMGPVYAWYPVLKSLKAKGASPFHTANFIGNRSIKPVLLPVLMASLGWHFSAWFVAASFAGALITAFIVDLFCSDSGRKAV